MSANVLLSQLRKRREKTVDLGDGKSVTFLRPPESAMGTMLTGDGQQRTWVVGVEDVRRCVNGWAGFTEADLLGAGVGGNDMVEFNAELWAEICNDSLDWINLIGAAILKSVVDHLTAKEATAKNSEPA